MTQRPPAALRGVVLPVLAGLVMLAVSTTLFRPGFAIAPPAEPVVAGRAAEPAPPAPASAPSDPAFSGRSVEAPPLTLTGAERDRLVSRGQALVEAGDMAAARLLLRRAADAGDARAIFALAATYDPNILATSRVVGLQGDAAHARALYEQALGDGVEAARSRLAALSR